MKTLLFIISFFVLYGCSAKLMEERFDWTKFWSKCKCDEEKIKKEIHFGPDPVDSAEENEEEEGWFPLW